MPPASSHPIQRFKAPSSITTGQPLKDLFDAKLVGLIGASVAAVHPGFRRARFRKVACDGLEQGSMLQRAAHIADALAAELPASFPAAAKILNASLGPTLAETSGNGLRTFFYLPHSAFVAKHGVAHFDAGMKACYEITRRSTAEFCIRPFVMQHQPRALARLLKWTRDPDPHVRRLCTEGTRPRLPWASRLPALAADPELALPLLEALKNDSELYVRRSVANHLGDLCKDHPEWTYQLCRDWLDEVAQDDDTRRKERHWMIRHAVRLPAKKGVRAALQLRAAAKAPRKTA